MPPFHSFSRPSSPPTSTFRFSISPHFHPHLLPSIILPLPLPPLFCLSVLPHHFLFCLYSTSIPFPLSPTIISFPLPPSLAFIQPLFYLSYSISVSCLPLSLPFILHPFTLFLVLPPPSFYFFFILHLCLHLLPSSPITLFHSPLHFASLTLPTTPITPDDPILSTSSHPTNPSLSHHLLFVLASSTVPIQAGVITGAIIGVVLGLLVLIVAIYYLMRFLVARRVFNLSVRSVPGLCPAALCQPGLCQGLGLTPEPIPGTETCVAKQA